MMRTYKIGVDVIGDACEFFARRGYRVTVIPTVRDEVNYTGQPVRRVDYYVEVQVDAPDYVHEAYDKHRDELMRR